MEAIRTGRNTYTIEYKKQKMNFTTKEYSELQKEIYLLNI